VPDERLPNCRPVSVTVCPRKVAQVRSPADEGSSLVAGEVPALKVGEEINATYLQFDVATLVLDQVAKALRGGARSDAMEEFSARLGYETLAG